MGAFAIVEVVVGFVSLCVRVAVPLIKLLDPMPPAIVERTADYQYAESTPAVDDKSKPVLEHFWIKDLDPLTPGIQPCGPCKLFEKDWKEDKAFREAILSRYRVVDYESLDRWPLVASRGVMGYPSFFDTKAMKMIEGYEGKTQLLKELGIEVKATAKASASEDEINLALELLRRARGEADETEKTPTDFVTSPPPADGSTPAAPAEIPFDRLGWLAGLLGLGAWYERFLAAKAAKQKADEAKETIAGLTGFLKRHKKSAPPAPQSSGLL